MRHFTLLHKQLGCHVTTRGPEWNCWVDDRTGLSPKFSRRYLMRIHWEGCYRIIGPQLKIDDSSMRCPLSNIASKSRYQAITAVFGFFLYQGFRLRIDNLPWWVWLRVMWCRPTQLHAGLRKQVANRNHDKNLSWNSNIPRTRLDGMDFTNHNITNLMYKPMGFKYN